MCTQKTCLGVLSILGHSGKHAMCSKLYNQIFDEHMVKFKSDNHSDAACVYQMADIKRKKMASDVLIPDIIVR